jgi:chaperonin GroES
VIVLPDPIVEEVTEGGVHLPEAKTDRSRAGVIVAVGPGERRSDCSERLPMDYSVGERVLFNAKAGFDVTVDGVKYLALRQKEVLALLS